MTQTIAVIRGDGIGPEIMDATLQVLDGLKLGLEFFCAHGHHGVHEIARVGLPIFLDLKLHDIPNTVAGAMQAIHVLEPAIVTVHAAGGRAMMEDAKAAAANGTKVVAVALLTSLDERDLARTGVAGSPHDQVMRLAELAHTAGLDGVVCSGHEVKAVREQLGPLLAPVPAPVGARGGEAVETGEDVEGVGRGHCCSSRWCRWR